MPRNNIRTKQIYDRIYGNHDKSDVDNPFACAFAGRAFVKRHSRHCSECDDGDIYTEETMKLFQHDKAPLIAAAERYGKTLHHALELRKHQMFSICLIYAGGARASYIIIECANDGLIDAISVLADSPDFALNPYPVLSVALSTAYMSLDLSRPICKGRAERTKYVRLVKLIADGQGSVEAIKLLGVALRLPSDEINNLLSTYGLTKSNFLEYAGSCASYYY